MEGRGSRRHPRARAARRGALVLACIAVTLWALEGLAAACLSNINCSGVTPVCGTSLTCRACESDLECGAPLSGDYCATSGSQKGACVPGGPVSDASTATCATDADCGVGLVCDTGAGGTSACVVGCHGLPGGGDTCPIGERCNVASTTIGVCLASSGDAGTSTGACSTDTDCVPGLVCTASDGGSTCVVGCHQNGTATTCPAGAECSSADGGLGLCVWTVGTDAGPAPEACSKDTDCAAGLVCSGGDEGGVECVVGCHADGGIDTCSISTHCSVIGGGLGACLRNSGIGSGTSTGSCGVDSDCVDGLVCDHSLDGGASCIFGCHATGSGSDTCPLGAHCSDIGGGVGVCLENGKTSSSPGDASAPDGSGAAGDAGGAGAEGGASSDGGGTAVDGGDGGSSTLSDSGSGGTGLDGAGGDASSAGDATIEPDASGGSDSGASDSGASSDATLAGDGETTAMADASGVGDAGDASGDGAAAADGGSPEGTLEGAGCSCSAAPGAGSTAQDSWLGALGMVGGLALVAGRPRRRRNRGKKPGRTAR